MSRSKPHHLNATEAADDGWQASWWQVSWQGRTVDADIGVDKALEIKLCAHAVTPHGVHHHIQLPALAWQCYIGWPAALHMAH